ncbi:MAG: AAA family ATPase [Methylococcaceae bacterium]|nr:AAA family ATPase [Methylococcaceae bacterium]MCI0732353.1 AAA family ATPase [Methylococcaceae bacterium]
MPLPRLIEALLQPEIYPDSPSSVRLVETHISWVLLTGELAYKIKKPVRFPFLDFSRLPLRRHYCQEELRLNRRLASGLYLEVVPIRGRPEKPTFSGSTPAIEYAVKMRQFDREAEFDRLAVNQRLQPVHIDRLADTVANFHLNSPKFTGPAAAGNPESIHAAAMRNFSELSPLARPDEPCDALARLREWTMQKFAECRDFMQIRSESGFIRECHGDLHLGNIVAIDGHPVPFDCIEFNEEMRWIDVIDEIAFIVMDLCAHRLPEYGYRLLNRYLQITGDFQALALLDYYRVYRALVRAKIALFSRNPATRDHSSNEGFEAKYRTYIAVALASTSRTFPILMITHGLSGSGKSTVAAQIAEKLPAIQVRSDVERKRLVLTDPRFDHALYSEEATRITYRHLAETAARLLNSGHSVIVDATFLQQTRRNQFRLLAEKSGAEFLILDFQAPLGMLRARITERLLANNDPSDAGIEVLESQMEHREPLTRSERKDSVSIRSRGKIDIGVLINRIVGCRSRDRKTQSE